MKQELYSKLPKTKNSSAKIEEIIEYYEKQLYNRINKRRMLNE